MQADTEAKHNQTLRNGSKSFQENNERCIDNETQSEDNINPT